MTLPKEYLISVIVCSLVFMVLFVGCGKAWAYTDTEIVNAIYKAEGGVKTRFPYGVRSIKCTGEAECRQICLNSVRNGRKRWERAGMPGSLIVWIGNRYSPPASNPNWVRLVMYFLKEGDK